MFKPTLSELAAKAGISKGTASDILNGKSVPSMKLAIHIFRTTGWRPSNIADLTDEQIDSREQRYPYRPRKKRAA